MTDDWHGVQKQRALLAASNQSARVSFAPVNAPDWYGLFCDQLVGQSLRDEGFLDFIIG